MSGIKKLAGQTMWYGVSSIVVKSIGYLLAPLLTYSHHVNMDNFGRQTLLYSVIPVASIIFTYGFETAYFRFSSKEEHKHDLQYRIFFHPVFNNSVLNYTVVF